MFHFRRMGGVLAAAWLLCGVESRAQEFTNGGFETVIGTPIPPNTGAILYPGDVWLPGWSAGGPGGTVVVQNGDLGEDFFGTLEVAMAPWQGQQWVIFPNDFLGGSLSQTFQTNVGEYCTISFVGTYVYTGDDPLLGVTVAASDGSVISNNVYELSLRDWTGFQLSFLTTTASTTLTFYDASASAQDTDIGLDGVTLVTEPPGWPYLISSPTNETNAAGTLATFSAQVGGYPSTVQWYLGNEAVTNATNATLTVIASEATAGSYTAVFSNSIGTNSSEPAILTVLQVVTSPTNQTATAGSYITLSASCNLSGAKVQWYFGADPIRGQTSTTLPLLADNQTAGSYTAQFTVGTAIVTSSAALLTVLDIPFINGSFEQINDTTIPSGDDLGGNPSDTWLTGWDFGGNTNEVFVFNGSFLGLDPADGNQWVVFDSENSTPAGVVFQTFSTTVGQAYLVTFSAMAIYYDGAPPKSLTASALASDGAVLASDNVDPPAEEWSTNQLTFTAETVNTTLAFTDTSFPNYGPSVALDAVTVTAVGLVSPPSVPPLLTVLPSTPGSGLFAMQLAGDSGQTYVLQTSTNLTAWLPVSTNVVMGSPVNITNAVVPGATRQFWRAIPAP